MRVEEELRMNKFAKILSSGSWRIACNFIVAYFKNMFWKTKRRIYIKKLLSVVRTYCEAKSEYS